MTSIKELMRSGSENPVVSSRSCMRDVIEMMDAKKLGAICVIEEERLVGIFTDGDLRRLILKTQDTLPDIFMKKIEKHMTTSPKVISPGKSLQDCLLVMTKNRFWVIPVVGDQNRLLGIVHMQDLITKLIDKG